MRGLNRTEYDVILTMVQKHHAFGRIIPQIDRITPVSYGIKYVETIWDCRFNDIYSITFRSGGIGVRLSTNHYNEANPAPNDFLYETLFNWCKAYLRGEFRPTDEFCIDYRK